MGQYITIFCCICLTAFVFGSESSTIKWKVMNKSIKIGEDAILNCNVNSCSSNTRKTWYGGRSHELLCYDDISTNPSKYAMKSYNTSYDFSLTIKQFNFTDINCEYTCACGFNRYTHMLRLDDFVFVYDDVKDSSMLLDDSFYVEVEMKVYSIPICFIVYKEYSTPVNVVESDTSNVNVSSPNYVTIHYSLDVDPRDSELLINLTCQVGSSKYNVSVYVWDIDIGTDGWDIASSTEIGNFIIWKITLITIGVCIAIVIILTLLRICKETFYIIRSTKTQNSDICELMLS